MAQEFVEVTDYLKILLENVKYTEEFLVTIKDAIQIATDVKEEIENEKSSTFVRGRISPEFVNTRVYDACFQVATEMAPQILVEEVAKAAKSTTEYSDPILLGPLMEAAKSPDNFQYLQKRASWASTIIPIIDMDNSAGTLEQWAQGVEATREQLGSHRKSAARASNYWRLKIYHRSSKWGSYTETLGMRFENSGALAPYWSLLDSGNMGGEGIAGVMSSDWGGTPYPTNGPTGFINKTVTRIQEAFAAELLAWRESLTSLSEQIKEQLKILDDYIKRLNELVTLIGNTGGDVIEDLEAKPVFEHYAKIRDGVNPNKISLLVHQLMAGAEIPSRPTIGINPRTGNPIRPRGTTIAAILEAAYGE